MKFSFSLLIIFVMSFGAWGQGDSKQSLFIGSGIGIMTNSQGEGFGILNGIGLQKSVWHERLRLIPQYTWGGFNNYGTTDVPDSHWYSRSARLDINLDLLKVRSFSLIIGTGITGNLTSGLVGIGGWGSTNYGFFSETHVGANVMLGFRQYSKDKRFGYELRLFDVGFKPIQSTDFVEAAVFKFQLLFNLQKMNIE